MLNVKKMLFVFLLFFLSLTPGLAFADVIIIGNNVSRSFRGFEANFASPMKESGEYGKLYLADPLDACSKLTNRVNGTGKNTMFSFALIIRGVCSFEAKVRKAQQAGFKAAIIFDNLDGVLFEIAGNSDGIRIHAMFISKMSGEILAKYAVVDRDVQVLIVPNFENSAWSIMAIFFVSLLSMSSVLASCFIVRRHRIRRERPRRASQVREFHGMSSHLVKAMPSLIFTSVLDDRCTSMTCAICLEDYTVGEKLRVLPCCHKFHASCVDAWLTTWRTFCPVCKRDARTTTSSCDPPPSEWTPLLSVSTRVSIPPSSSSSSSSSRSSISNSPAIQIYPSSSSSHWIPQIHSASAAISYEHQQQQHSVQSYRHCHSPFLGATIRKASSYRSIASPHSSDGYPLNSQYLSPPYYPNFVGQLSSSGRHCNNNNTLHCSESADSFLSYDSAQSFPGC